MKSEAEIREILERYITSHFEGEVTLVPEFYLEDHARRIDILTITEKYLIGFEIKSASDSLKRLENQVATYEKYLDKVIVVCSQKHIRDAEKILDPSIGLWEISDTGNIKKLRRGKLKKIKKEFLIRSLTVKDMKESLKVGNERIQRKVLSERMKKEPHKSLKRLLVHSVTTRRVNKK